MMEFRSRIDASRSHQTIWVALVALALTLLGGTPAAAHTGFESSDPADGSLVTAEVDRVVLTFTGTATPTGEGFAVLDSTNTVRVPESVTSSEGGEVWTLVFDPALPSGTVGLRWTVQAPDAHPISGSIRFTISVEPSSPNGTDGTSSTNDSELGATVENGEAPAQASTQALLSEPSGSTGSALDDFLASTEQQQVAYAEGVGAFGRLLGFLGTMLGIGGLVFVAVVIKSYRRDVNSVLAVVRYSAIAVVIGTTIDVAAHLETAGNSWQNVLDPDALDAVMLSPFGTAIALRVTAGAILFGAARLGLRTPKADPVSIDNRELVQSGASAPLRSQSSEMLGVLPDGHTQLPLERPGGQPRSGHQQPLSPAAAVGVGLLLVSFTFDGHTITEGNRWITGGVDMVHVVAASIWAGGVVAFSTVLWQRHRRGECLNGLEMALRFSVIAGAALTTAGVAGTILVAIILNSVSDLYTTPWGLLLIAKTLAVATAALVGAYNHFIIIPWMQTHPNDDNRSVKLRKTVTVEAVLLITAIATTALLVGATAQP